MQRISTIDKLFYQELGKNLREIRHDSGFTLRKLSEKTGFSRTLIDCWELGFNRIKKEQFERICEVLQVSPKLTIDVKIGF